MPSLNGPGCVKMQKNSAREKFGRSARPLSDFLSAGNGHPTNENFVFLRFYTASANSGSSNGYASSNYGISIKVMNNKKSYEERFKETFTKGLSQRIGELSKRERTAYYCIVGFVFVLVISVHIYLLFFA